MAMKQVKIFYCYHDNHDNQKDKRIKEELTKYIDNDYIISQDYTNILAGKDRRKVIDERLASIDILLLLISADFISSYHGFMEEIQVALERHARGDIHIIAIILRSCPWEHRIFAGKPLREWKVLPDTQTPVNLHSDRDQVLTEIAHEVHRVAEPIKQKYKKEWCLEEAERYSKQGEYEKADNELKEALECLSNDESASKEKADIWSKIGSIRRKGAHWQSALEAYLKAIDLCSGDAQTFVAVGEIYYRELSNRLKAIEAYTKAIELEHQNIELYEIKCALLLQEGQPGKALETCDAAIAQASNDAQLMRYKGQILYERQEYQEACKIYKDVLEVDPDNPYLHKEYGDVLLKWGPQHSKEARDAYEKAIEIYNRRPMNELPFRNEIIQKLEEANRGRTQQLWDQDQ